MHMLSMYEAREKLRKLDEYLGCDPEGVLVAFGWLIADRLHDLLTPTGFIRICTHIIEDMHTGTNRETGQQIYSSLIGQHDMYRLYQLLKEEIPTIADAVFPPDFAADVRNALGQSNHAAMRKE